MSNTKVNLYVNHANDLQYVLNVATTAGFHSITTPLVSPLFTREFQDSVVAKQHIPFSRSDLILKSSQWLNGVICRLSDNLDLDSDSEAIRKHGEETLKQEIAFAEHVLQMGYYMIRLRSGKVTNMARTLSSFNKCGYRKLVRSEGDTN